MKTLVMPPAAVRPMHLVAQAQEVAHILKNLAHPQRLLVLCRLTRGEANVSQLQELLGLEQAIVSQILARLRRQRLVLADKRGQQVFYRLAEARIAELLATLIRLYCEELEGVAS